MAAVVTRFGNWVAGFLSETALREWFLTLHVYSRVSIIVLTGLGSYEVFLTTPSAYYW